MCCVLLMSGLAATQAQADDLNRPTEPLWRWFQGELQLGVGIDYSRGDYDEDVDTDMVFVPFSASYLFDEFALTPTRRDQLALRVIVPYLYIDGPITAGDSGATKEDGIGDVIVGASYLYYPAHRFLPAADLKFNVKLPSADEDDSLGTGKTDYTLGLTLFQRYGDFAPFVSGSYRFIGKNKPDFSLRDGATAGVGGSWLISSRFDVGVSYDWRRAISKRSETTNNLVQADDAHEITFYGSARFDHGLRVAPYAVVGLADGSPDFALGLQLNLTVPVRPRQRDP